MPSLWGIWRWPPGRRPPPLRISSSAPPTLHRPGQRRPFVSAHGGAPPPGALGNGHRRAKKRRYSLNRAGQSHTTVVLWNAKGLRKKIGELQRWLPAVKLDVLAAQEGHLPKAAPRIPGYQPPVDVQRTLGRVTGAAVVKGGDVALYVRAGLHLSLIDDRLTAVADDTTEV